jgi:hypothetical protein
MSEQAFEWKLTPTERRIAEVAFANGNEGEWGAILAVARLRGERLGYSEAEENAACKAMLAELRREPEAHGSEWRTALEWALGLEPDAENHTPEWAANLVREIREIGNRR